MYKCSTSKYFSYTHIKLDIIYIYLFYNIICILYACRKYSMLYGTPQNNYFISRTEIFQTFSSISIKSIIFTINIVNFRELNGIYFDFPNKWIYDFRGNSKQIPFALSNISLNNFSDFYFVPTYPWRRLVVSSRRLALLLKRCIDNFDNSRLNDFRKLLWQSVTILTI